MSSPKKVSSKARPKANSPGRGLRIFLILLLIASGSFAAFSWYRYHPYGVTPVVGPAGQSHWAFIENRSPGKPNFVLCASDWPHTRIAPAALGSVLPTEGSNGRAFWSVDGSVLVHRSDDQYTAAYDFREHKVLRGHWTDIAALVDSRGGLGAEQDVYPQGKGG